MIHCMNLSKSVFLVSKLEKNLKTKKKNFIQKNKQDESGDF